MTEPLKIMVTNDDGIDSIGLHVLAREMRQFGEVTVVAPDQEFSGAGAAIGAIWENQPEVHKASIEGIDTVWTVTGPPALCVLFARIGAFGFTPDLIVSGINPGANVGRSVYHSGTVGATLTGRNGGISGVAVSQAVSGFGIEGQAWGDVVASIDWNTSAKIAAAAVKGMIASPPPQPSVLNINVPDLPLDEITEYEWTEVGTAPPGAMSEVKLTPKPGHLDSFTVELNSGERVPQPEGTDTRAMVDGVVSLAWLSHLNSLNPADRAPATPAIDAEVQALL